MNGDAFLPAPETWHPSFPDAVARQVVESLEHWPHPAVDLLRPPRLPWFAEDAGDVELEVRRVVLSIRKATGPAPFVGDPQLQEARYFWKVATGEAGRWIAGPAVLEWRRR